MLSFVVLPPVEVTVAAGAEEVEIPEGEVTEDWVAEVAEPVTVTTEALSVEVGEPAVTVTTEPLAVEVAEPAVTVTTDGLAVEVESPAVTTDGLAVELAAPGVTVTTDALSVEDAEGVAVGVTIVVTGVPETMLTISVGVAADPGVGMVWVSEKESKVVVCVFPLDPSGRIWRFFAAARSSGVSKVEVLTTFKVVSLI